MRKLKPQLERIDIDELFNNSSNRGMLSFLERPPEEAQARLREKQRVNVADSRRLSPAGDLPPVGDLRPGGELPPEQRQTTPFPAAVDSTKASESLEWAFAQPAGDLPPGVGYPLGQPPLRVSHPLDQLLAEEDGKADEGTIPGPVGKSPTGNSHSGEEASSPPPTEAPPICYPVSELPVGDSLTGQDTASQPKTAEPLKAFRPEGDLPRGYVSALIDGSVVGRRQKIRRAYVAQDGHSSGEQLLYQSLWNAARAETQETRIVCIGYSGMSGLCKLDRSNCKKNIQSLVEKLSVQVTEAYESASSTGTTYRIFSYKEILRRREAAGMIWVIRTSGVRFVNPLGNLPTPPVGDLPPEPLRDLHPAPLRKAPIPPVGETPTPLGKNKNSEGTTTSGLVYNALSNYGVTDDDAVKRLIQNCRALASDCTEQEIVQFIHEKGRLIKVRGSNIQNPIGFLIDAVPKCFAGESFRAQRSAAAHKGREVTAVSRTDELQQTCWLLRELPKSVNAGRWRETLAVAQDDETVSEDLRALIVKVLAGAE